MTEESRIFHGIFEIYGRLVALWLQDPFLSIPIHQLQETAIAQDLNSAPSIPFRIATEIKNCTLYEGTKVYHL